MEKIYQIPNLIFKDPISKMLLLLTPYSISLIIYINYNYIESIWIILILHSQ